MRWCQSWRADPAAARLADRHYNRQKIGTTQFVPPGRCAVFLTDCGRGVWVSSWPIADYVLHEWAGAWVCSLFRSEGAGCASDLIRQALAATRACFGEPPALGLVTFIDRRKVKPIMVRGRPTWGWTWIKAGFRCIGETSERRYLVFQILPEEMPPAAPPKPMTMHGTPLFDWRARA